MHKYINSVENLTKLEHGTWTRGIFDIIFPIRDNQVAQ